MSRYKYELQILTEIDCDDLEFMLATLLKDGVLGKSTKEKILATKQNELNKAVDDIGIKAPTIDDLFV